ncbi:MAG: methionine biosynthesis protein MetW [Gammaproteobacteria bacterium]|nr:methionine biosynthesis protein MetW [Gammaproteobacteria bacterium]
MPVDREVGDDSGLTDETQFHGRLDFTVIAEWVQSNSRVLDLGCGDGALLRFLADTKAVSGYGIEIDDKHIAQCIANRVNVIQVDLDHGLTEFDDQSFDYVILSLTLQAARHPEILLQEMLRVGRSGILTFPNFAHWRARLQLGIQGKMPVTQALPNPWHSTPNIHLCTLNDFEALCRRLGVRILEREIVDADRKSTIPFWPNLFGEIALYRCATN